MRRLLIRPGAIGDCIVSFPALQHLRTSYTEVWISSPVVPLVDFADAVSPLSATGLDSVAIGDRPMPQTVRERLLSFDSIVSWYGSNRAEFRDALHSLGLPVEFHAALPPADFPGHAIEFYAGQVHAPRGMVPRICIERPDRHGTVILHPFSGSARKNWPLAHFELLAKHIAAPVQWTAGPEQSLPQAVRFADLRQLARWLAGAALYVGNDSGIAHLAAAVGTPVLAIFGPTSPARWAPRGPNVTVLQHEPLPDFSVETVLENVNRMLA